MLAGCSPRFEVPSYMPVDLAELVTTANENVVVEGRPVSIDGDGFSLVDGTNSVRVQRDADYSVYLKNGEKATIDYSIAAAALGRAEREADVKKVRVFGKKEEDYLPNGKTNRFIGGRFVLVGGTLYPIYK